MNKHPPEFWEKSLTTSIVLAHRQDPRLTNSDLAEILGAHKETVRSICKRLKIKLPPGKPGPKDRRGARAILMQDLKTLALQSEAMLLEIVKQFQIDPETVTVKFSTFSDEGVEEAELNLAKVLRRIREIMGPPEGKGL